MYSQFHFWRIFWPQGLHVDCNGLDYCTFLALLPLCEQLRVLTSMPGWCHFTDDGFLSSAHYGCAVHHGNWNRFVYLMDGTRRATSMMLTCELAGIETSTVPMYQSELCEAHKRGRLVCSEALFVGVGIVIAYFFDYGMNFSDQRALAWRLPIACQMIFCFVCGNYR